MSSSSVDTARTIVANLGRRWRRLRSTVRKIDVNHPQWIIAVTVENEAWNAFEASRRILYGQPL